MPRKINCWEYMKCGREPGGKKARELGVCAAATYSALDGLNGGTNGGRMCWAIVGSYCFGEITGFFTKTNPFYCYDCEFHRKVLSEEGIIRLEPLRLHPSKIRNCVHHLRTKESVGSGAVAALPSARRLRRGQRRLNRGIPSLHGGRK